ncbi:alpha/beta hydrolase [Luteipulveratus mongoliensis]|uniref:Acyl-CoA:diacylglycerol acyltransferase n=1 Tax=Luteipulveratus mongoliensis TaxID=571913 RepID=A0A0K1JES7_9MICO|nr:alpha/beta hydrolase family protein [Luteipulveratus mongoliensis]AKU15108.1 esterase [Luteipulveratus mongoliensis]
MSHEKGLSRRSVLKVAGGVAAATALGGGVSLTTASSASAAGPLTVTAHETYGRMEYYRFATDEIEWDPAVNVLLPSDYYTSGKTYPVLYLLHGGQQDFRSFDMDPNFNLRGFTEGKDLIIVMPDGGAAGWYSNPVNANNGPHNWETFHMGQLVPWIEGNFRTFAEYDGRAVSGFSMGGFGALKYTTKYFGHFASISAHSGPADLRWSGGAVAHWANVSSMAVELAGGSIYGVPAWDQGRVSADNPMEHIESFRNKRIFLVAGTSPAPTDPWSVFNETGVLATQRVFKDALRGAGIPFEDKEVDGGHWVRPDLLQHDIEGVIARLRKA